MWYVLEKEVAASTSYADRTETTIKVSGGILHTIFVTIPPGSLSLVHCQLRTGSYFIIPRNEDKDISGELANVEFKEWLQLKSADNDLTLIAWNEDIAYSHKVRLLIGVLPKATMEFEEKYINTIQEFVRLFRRRT